MDLLPVPKEQRFFESADIIDRISKLPDELLAKILNFLPTKQAVATTILSKRWEHLWTLTSDLDFSDQWIFENYQSATDNNFIIKMRFFQEYVDRVIFYHGGSHIRKCNMSFHSKYVASRVYACILAVVTCNVQQLSLRSFQNHSYYQLPWMLFSSKTLVDLAIFGNFVIDLPTYVWFPCLKSLRIHMAMFVDDASMERLFSSCPVLEELIIGSQRGCLQIMNISVPWLKRLCICSLNLQIKINTPCLEYLEIFPCGEVESSRYSFNFTSSLVRAHVEDFDILLLNAVSDVEYLTLKGNDTSLENIIRDSALPIFKNLKTLKLLVGFPEANDWAVLPYLLDSSPNLQALIFPQGLVPFTINREDFNHFDWERPEFVPGSWSMNIKTIDIYKFVGFKEELDIVQYLLESAKMLEKMIIHKFEVSENPIMDLKVKGDKDFSWLLSSRRSCSRSEVMCLKTSSSTCQVIFID